jgi:hypothetical protein
MFDINNLHNRFSQKVLDKYSITGVSLLSEPTMRSRLIVKMKNNVTISLHSDDDITQFFIKCDREIRKEKIKKIRNA